MFLYIHRLVLSTIVVTMLAACSGSEEPAEKGRIEQATGKIAQEAMTSIKTPIDHANLAKELSENHNTTIEKTGHQVGK